MHKYIYIILFSSLLFLTGCSEDDEGDSLSQGWHYPGRDCLACHNVDLGEDKHLLFAGTVYKYDSVIDTDNVDNLCGGELFVEFLDSSYNLALSSKDYKDSTSPGYNGKGNIFILQRELRLLSAQNYTMRITNVDGLTMAQSLSNSHTFTSQDYDINLPGDWNNRLSCNSCHRVGGVTKPLSASLNVDLCK